MIDTAMSQPSTDDGSGTTLFGSVAISGPRRGTPILAMQVNLPAHGTAVPDAVVPWNLSGLTDHMHELNPSESRSSRPEGLEPQHWSHSTLDCTVVLFNERIVRSVASASTSPLLPQAMPAIARSWPCGMRRMRSSSIAHAGGEILVQDHIGDVLEHRFWQPFEGEGWRRSRRRRCLATVSGPFGGDHWLQRPWVSRREGGAAGAAVRVGWCGVIVRWRWRAALGG